jgi:dTDP-4-amino-4,6-dideoxygalactose transaminase
VFTSENLRLPNCEWLTERILSLPVHPALSEAELERVADTVLKVTRLMYR